MSVPPLGCDFETRRRDYQLGRAFPAYGERMTRSAFTVIVAAAALCVPPAGATAHARSFVVESGPTSQQVGDFVVWRDPTYRGAIAAFGPASFCRLIRGDPTWAMAAWLSLGLHIELRTYGSPPAGETGCTAPDSIRVAAVTLTDRRWRTTRGLRIGDRAARLKRLYPAARVHSPRSRWIVTTVSRCAIGVCPRKYVVVPRLIGRLTGGRVSAFVLPVGAQGD